MGGHGHGHEPPYKVPNPDLYKVEEIPELKAVQDKLAKLGLKDPWLRNEVWRYQQCPLSPLQVLKTILFRGMKIGIPAFLITIGIEHYYGIDYGHGGHGEDHHDSH